METMTSWPWARTETQPSFSARDSISPNFLNGVLWAWKPGNFFCKVVLMIEAFTGPRTPSAWSSAKVFAKASIAPASVVQGPSSPTFLSAPFLSDFSEFVVATGVLLALLVLGCRANQTSANAGAASPSGSPKSVALDQARYAEESVNRSAALSSSAASSMCVFHSATTLSKLVSSFFFCPSSSFAAAPSACSSFSSSSSSCDAFFSPSSSFAPGLDCPASSSSLAGGPSSASVVAAAEPFVLTTYAWRRSRNSSAFPAAFKPSSLQVRCMSR
mmetsp:Transcript_11121/g.39357  ORF Transcript_11121/g.39357 Transcript_11121/m.39357 type:complete len:273 (-) Transcript_11121:333-1151(-)